MKKILKNNKLVIFIVIVLIICLGAICYVAATYFFGGSDSVYGDRLDEIDDYPFTEIDMEDIILVVEENEDVISASLRLSGKIIYMSTEFSEEIFLEEAKKYAATFIEYIDETLLEYYDVNYTVSTSEYTLMGYKNSINNSLVWNNNTSFDEESE